MNHKEKKKGETRAKLTDLLGRYYLLVVVVLVLAFVTTGLGLLLPKIIAGGIDSYSAGNFDFRSTILWFSLVSFGAFIAFYLQSILQVYVSETMARDLRIRLVAKISQQTYANIVNLNTNRLLTNVTGDVDAVKAFMGQAIVAIATSAFSVFGAAILLIITDWQLALAVLAILPIVGVAFFFIFRQIRELFKKTQETVDRLNSIINESILGSALIRVLNAQQSETGKFLITNARAKEIGLEILRLFSGLIPIIVFMANMGVLIILGLGGHFVVVGKMSLGNFVAFQSYLSMLVFPIIMIGFMSTIIAQAQAAYSRIAEVLEAPEEIDTGNFKANLTGKIVFNNVSITRNEKLILRDVSFEIKPGTKNAIIGPTAAGKTQLLYLLTGLIESDFGKVELDGKDVRAYDKENLHRQIGFVFQDSVIFNISLRENIAFNKKVTDADMEKAIATAELAGFVETLPQKLNTVLPERGASLSGGQKQRVMLARALALNPKILLLDDFTARVDSETERKILENLWKNYPGITLVSVTQKIWAVENYDQIILLMEGEVLAKGRHEDLLTSSPEYVQIFNSQKSTNHYELRAE